MAGIYDAAMDNVSCLLPIDRPADEVWTRYCDVRCADCGAQRRFDIVTPAPKQHLADSALKDVMAEAGWLAGPADSGDYDYCPECR